MSSSIWEHFPTGQSSPGTPPALLSAGSMYSEASRLKQEVEEAHRVLKHWDHSWRQMTQVRLLLMGKEWKGLTIFHTLYCFVFTHVYVSHGCLETVKILFSMTFFHLLLEILTFAILFALQNYISIQDVGKILNVNIICSKIQALICVLCVFIVEHLYSIHIFYYIYITCIRKECSIWSNNPGFQSQKMKTFSFSDQFSFS